ncbi:MAG: AAA domain-containing protein [Streptomycetaceae bacterium]|nr:AAA domain-containing protein [Streptomycetaceae bacterium]
MSSHHDVLPYDKIVGQEDLKLALEIAYVNPRVGGVLAAGQRGTAKTTTVRAFALAIAGELPVTLPIGATEDRVLGGWQIDKLMRGDATRQDGLLVQASHSKAKMLYVDEINLLDDYLVDIILDAVATGNLDVQRDHLAEAGRRVDFTLVGTMNPDEGGLRPQLLDRFGLVAVVEPVEDMAGRAEIVRRVFDFQWGQDGSVTEDTKVRAPMWHPLGLDVENLSHARVLLRGGEVRPSGATVDLCARLAAMFQTSGHRAELVMLNAAVAVAAMRGSDTADPEDVHKVAKLALVHRRSRGESGTLPAWTDEDQAKVEQWL